MANDFPPHLLAKVDQYRSTVDDVLDKSVGFVVEALRDDMDPGVAAITLQNYFCDMDAEKLRTAAAFAIVRLAQHKLKGHEL